MVTRLRLLISGSIMFLALAASITLTPAAQAQQASFDGAWRTVEVVVPGATSRTYKPDAAIAIFHGRYYSRIEEHTEQPRPVLADPTTASADQLRAIWGPFVGEAGTFELGDNNTITMQAMVAKNPAAMTKGAVSVYTYRRDGNVLMLTQVRTHAGPSPAITIKLARVE